MHLPDAKTNKKSPGANPHWHIYNYYYSCGLSTATIEYSCPSVCVGVCLSVCLSVRPSVPPSVCLSVCVSVYTITQKIMVQIDLKLEHIVVYENSSDEFDIGHCPIKVKKKFRTFLHLTLIIAKIS